MVIIKMVSFNSIFDHELIICNKRLAVLAFHNNLSFKNANIIVRKVKVKGLLQTHLRILTEKIYRGNN